MVANAPTKNMIPLYLMPWTNLSHTLEGRTNTATHSLNTLTLHLHIEIYTMKPTT